METTRQLAKAATVPLSLALHYVTAASSQIDLVIIESKATMERKAFWKTQQTRLAAIKNDVMARIKTHEARDTIRREHSDEFRIDAIMHRLMLLNEEGMNKAEEMLDGILNGQAV